MDNEDLDNFIDTELEKNDVVVFSKSWCPFSIKVKRILNEKNVEYAAFELDLLDGGVEVQKRLGERFGQLTVPNVFIKGQHVGGCHTVEELEACGGLDDLLEGHSGNYQYDVIVIGGGSGGLTVAKECARLGKKVCVCDYVKPSELGTTWGLGGTCTNVGCIPKKLMHCAAAVRRDIEAANAYGWPLQTDDLKHNWEVLVSGVQDYIKSLNWRNRRDLIVLGVRYVNGFASFIDKHTIKVTRPNRDDEQITAQNIIIAVGGRPKYPGVPGALDCLTSDDLFSLPEFPSEILILGASYVGLEAASFLTALGSKVSVMVRSVMLRGPEFDREIVAKLKSEMERDGVDFITDCTPVSISQQGGSFKVESMVGGDTARTDVFQSVLIAVGRVPSTQCLDLENAGIKVCKNGKIPTNDKDQTVVRNIFAIGDCVNNRPELTPVAVHTGRLLAKRLCLLDCQTTAEWRGVPRTVFTWPQYGCVGESEESAATLFGKDMIRVYTAYYRPVEAALVDLGVRCFAKLITVPDQKTEERVVGVHLLGPQAGEVVQGFALAVKTRVTKRQLDSLIGIHPTSAQIFTMLSLRGEDDLLEDSEAGC